MRRASLVVVLLTGCTEDDPSFIEPTGSTGAADDGADGTTTADGGLTGTETGGAEGSGGEGTESGATSSVDGSSTGGGTTGGACGPIEIEPIVAECRSSSKNPDQCEDFAGPGNMLIDLQTGYASFLSLEVPSEVANVTVLGASLRLTVTDDMGADGDSTGELWQVEPFVRSDLFLEEPAKVGDLPLGEDQGAVTQGDVVQWFLPPALIAPGMMVYLGVFPLTAESVQYWNLDGQAPPVLVLECE